MNSDIYNKVASRIGKILYTLGISETPFEYVNDGYLQLVELQSHIDEKSLFIAARNTLYNRHRFQKDGLSRETNKICSRCNDSKPIGCFNRAFDKKLQVHRISRWCSDCASRYCRNWRKKAGVREVQNRKRRERTKRMTDGYIRRRLTLQGFTLETITQKMIEKQRAKLINYRDRRTQKARSVAAVRFSVF